jgi:hypothetical protein
MSAPSRPTFSEGQVLGAGDLNAQVTYHRLAAVQHERTEHLWGVAEGLELQPIERSTSGGDKYVDVNLLPGRAVDRLGRSIVVTEPRLIDTTDFDLSSTSPGQLFPVFVQAIEVPISGQTQPGKCAINQTARVEERLQLSFGTPGSEIVVLEQSGAGVAAGFGTPALNDKVLVGWVSWNQTLGKFAGVAQSSNGRGIRYVGVVASEVVAGGGTLGLRTRGAGARFALTVTENSTGGCELRFGKQDGPGPVSDAFTVDEKGNVSYRGVLTPSPPAKTLAESGVAFDGVRLPLPSGVTEEQVAGGAVRLHALLTPIVLQPKEMDFAGTKTFAVPHIVQCEVDVTTDRRVHCRVRWYDPTQTVTNFIELPTACNYLFVASGK